MLHIKYIYSQYLKEWLFNVECPLVIEFNTFLSGLFLDQGLTIVTKLNLIW